MEVHPAREMAFFIFKITSFKVIKIRIWLPIGRAEASTCRQGDNINFLEGGGIKLIVRIELVFWVG